jgi:F-type H+-transporting ATPase subunit gamma
VAGVKEHRVRIKSVGSIKQITRAMEMVATTKLRRFQDRAVTSRPYAQEIAGLVGRLAAVLPEEELKDRPLLRQGPGPKRVLLVVSSDRGLCGAYNANLLRMLETWRRQHAGEPIGLFVYGRKAYQYCQKRGIPVEHYLTDPPLERMDFRNAQLVARLLTDEFLSGGVRDVHVLYTAFESMVRYVPELVPFLPVEAADLGGPGTGADGAKDGADAGDVILEPDAKSIFDSLLPRYLETRIYNALLEALTSEYASRRFAMKNATDAASDMQKALRGVYNRKRQENITKDLLDIVGGAEAVR